MMTRLSAIFPSVKIKSQIPKACSSEANPWSVYLIISTNTPIKTYVGVTTSFPRRLKEHNGELKGGAKATRSGRPWVTACLIEGFKDRSKASEFEAKWKTFSRKRRSKKEKDGSVEQENDRSLPLLRRRKAALSRVEREFDCSNLEIEWHLNP